MRHEDRPAGIQAQQGRDVVRFPAAKTHGDIAPALPGVVFPLPAKPGDHVEDRAALVGLGVQVAGVVQVGCREQFVDRALPLASAACDPVIGRSPAGIPGQAETADRLAQQKGFEADQGGHHIDVVHLFDQRERVDGIADEKAAGLALQVAEIAPFVSSADFRMGLDQQRRVGMFPPGGLQHFGERGVARQAAGDAGVALGLVDQQDPLAGRQRQGQRVGCGIVFAEPVLEDQVARVLVVLAGACQQIGGRGQQGLKPGAASGVVVDAFVIHDQRKAGVGGAGAEGPQEAILQCDVGQSDAFADRTRAGCAGAQAPADHRMDVMAMDIALATQMDDGLA